MDFDEVIDKAKDNAPLIIGGIVVLVVIFALTAGKNNGTNTVVQPVTEGDSYPTIDANADVIMANFGNLLEGAKKEIVDNMDGYSGSINSKLDSLGDGFDSGLGILSGQVSDIKKQVEDSRNFTMDKLEGIAKDTPQSSKKPAGGKSTGGIKAPGKVTSNKPKVPDAKGLITPEMLANLRG